MERKRLHKSRGKLADRAVPGAKEINRAILTRANQARRVCHRLAEGDFGHPRKTHRPDGRIVNRGIQEHAPQGLEHAQLLVGRAGDGLAPFLQFLPCGTRVVPEALIIELDRHIDMMGQGLGPKGHEDRITPCRVHALQLGHRGFPPELREPFHPVGIELGEIPRSHLHVEQRAHLRERLAQLRCTGGRRFAAEPIQDRPPGLRVWHQEISEQSRPGCRQERCPPISAERNSATIWDETAQFLPRTSDDLRLPG